MWSFLFFISAAERKSEKRTLIRSILVDDGEFSVLNDMV